MFFNMVTPAKEGICSPPLRCRHSPLILHPQKVIQERQKYLLSLLQPSSTNMTVELLWDLTVV